MRKKLKKSLSVVLTILLSFSFISFSLPITAYAGTQTFTLPTEVKPTPVNFINGSFEKPDLTTDWKASWGHGGSQGWAGVIPQAEVPGWNTYPINSSDLSNPYAFYINILTVRSGGASGFATTEADGNQYAELNCFVPGRLYQTVSTVPGSRIYWQFAHRARASGDNTSGTGKDVMKFYLRKGGTPSTAPTNAQLIKTASDDAKAWYYYRGVYTVPTGQTSTEFDFAYVSSATGNAADGNFLDDIKFQTGSSLIAKKSITTSASDNATALKGEIVTITVNVTNWGETDASRCVFRDVLSDGLEYVAGSAKVNGTSAGSRATFNSTTDELRINFGTGATVGTAVTNGGVLKGSVSMGTSGTTHQGETATITFQAKVTGNAGYVVKNQSRITYNDKDFESYNANGFTAYSSVQGKTPTSGNQSTYVNQFTIVDRSLNGRVWIDMDGDGMIDASETKVSGVTVGLYQNSDTAYTTPVKDINGNPLVTMTNANGAYSFGAVPAGTYKVVVTTPQGYIVTVKTVSTDNNAAASGTKAIASGIALTQTLTPTITSNIVNNVDLGFVPKLTAAKSSNVNSGSIDNGTAASPVEVGVGDTIEYTIDVPWNGSYGDVTGVDISDTIPAGLSLVTTAGSYTDGMTWNTDPSTGMTTVYWSDQTIASGGGQYKFKVTVDDIAAGTTSMEYNNKATYTLNSDVQETNYTYHKLSTYSLEVSKLVKGSLADPDQDFSFTVEFDGVSGALSYTGASSVAGVSAPSDGTISSGDTITLKHGQSIIISGLPSGANYTVTEAGVTGYSQSVTNNNASGTINSDVDVEFVNTKNEIVPTGIWIDIMPYAVIVVIAIAILIFLVIRKKMLVLHHKKDSHDSGDSGSNGL